ncbi:hypothetical protein GJAV_G00068950 [Gymnothorax javanicus]|nr:hypothetical protein GJAV_G00068950 [Gymnothorax javanicus]
MHKLVSLKVLTSRTSWNLDLESMAETKGKFDFAIDRGGTFTDVFARCPDGRERVLKLLSHDPQNYKDAPTEGIRRILEEETGRPFPREQPLDSSLIDSIRMGTTVATNALLERQGERTALLITRGFRDLLLIGTQARPKLFDLEVCTPELLYEEVIEVDERVVLHQENGQVPGREAKSIVTGSTGDVLEVWREVDLQVVERDLKGVLSRGITSLAVVFLHSYTWAAHEQAVGSLARKMGFTQVSLSSEVMPMVRAVFRGLTTCIDAYLTPKISQYLRSFTCGFKGSLKGVNLLFMQSDGGLTTVDGFCGYRALLSGPAGGVVGFANTCYNQSDAVPVIGVDMGGTSTDVSRYAGCFEHVFEANIAGIPVQAPQLDINTVAAGGGSCLFFRSGMFIVGPESAGAHPGPACYRKGGPLALTDANLVLGRLLPGFFPRIFGPGEDEPLSCEESMKRFRHLTREINHYLSSGQSLGNDHSNSGQVQEEYSEMSVEEVAMGFIRVANEAMCRPIRALTEAKGHDTSQHALACFGGAAGQHACAIARSLGMNTVYIHKYSGILSAYGLALADVVEEVQEPCSLTYEPNSYAELDMRAERLLLRCQETLRGHGFSSGHISAEIFFHMRYEGTDYALMVNATGHPANAQSCRCGDFRSAFTKRHLKEFGFVIPDRPIMVDDIRVRGSGKLSMKSSTRSRQSRGPPQPVKVTQCYFDEDYLDTAVYLWDELSCDHSIHGPAIIIDKNSTILVEPCCVAQMTAGGDMRISVGAEQPLCLLSTELDAVQLSVFSHRFMSIAEQMGRVLQRTAISTNIKERLDYSCALFGVDGSLVANAPHIPVHLGAMQDCVQYQHRAVGKDLKEGDVLLSNHPAAGGSHLPDLTHPVPHFTDLTSAHHSSESRPILRGHHADIGGQSPGSMPSNSTCLQEEGAIFISEKLVTEDNFNEQNVTKLLLEPAKYAGCSGARSIRDNLSDLRAQVAANQKGRQLVEEMIDKYGLDVVQAYMGYIQKNAEMAVRDMLKEVARRRRQENRSLELSAEDQMDDGTVIKLRVQINEDEGSAVFDFSGTGAEVAGNCNAPRAITLSALIYCLRCMVRQDIPLNQGCLAPIKVHIPSGSILKPSQNAAVAGGNVLTSQRVVDVIFRAFEVCAASQGCMNNISFGTGRMGYYETVGGGAGAGPTWHGRSGVHSHMTNTRITDPEILEKRWGCCRASVRDKMRLSVLTERRAMRPYGLSGGDCGASGMNLLRRADGRMINLGGKNSVNVEPGDMFCLYTPGGGGYGKMDQDEGNGSAPPVKRKRPSEALLERGTVFENRKAQESK